MRRRRRLLILLMVLMLPMSAQAAEIPEDIRTYCEVAGEENNIAPSLLEAIAYTESGFNERAVNKAGTCFGLCQIYKKYHIKRMERLGVTDLFDKEGNIRVAADLLLELFETYEDVGAVLMKYNGATDKAINRYFETGKLPKYAQRVIDQSIQYEKEVKE